MKTLMLAICLITIPVMAQPQPCIPIVDPPPDNGIIATIILTLQGRCHELCENDCQNAFRELNRQYVLRYNSIYAAYAMAVALTGQADPDQRAREIYALKQEYLALSTPLCLDLTWCINRCPPRPPAKAKPSDSNDQLSQINLMLKNQFAGDQALRSEEATRDLAQLIIQALESALNE